ncbi:MAG: PEGA domain-containing protein [Kofleriaceae bacterium]
MRRAAALVIAVTTATAQLAQVAAARAQPVGPTDPPVATPESAEPQISPEAAHVTVGREPQEARRWLSAAHQLVQKADALARADHNDEARIHYENAITAFRNAIEADHDQSLWAQVAAVFEKLGQLDEAYRTYRKLARTTDGVRGEVQAKAAAKLAELAGKLGLVMLKITPEGAAIALGDQQLGRAPLAEPLVMMPGRYQLWLAADGFVPRAVEVNIEPGSEIERTIALDPVVVAPRSPASRVSTVSPAPLQPRAPSKMPLYVGGGIALIATGVSVATGLAAMSAHDTYVDSGTTRHERDDARARGRTLALASDVSLAAALVAGGMTVYWYFASYRPMLRASRAKVEVAPWVQSDIGGVVVVGSL